MDRGDEADAELLGGVLCDEEGRQAKVTVLQPAKPLGVDGRHHTALARQIGRHVDDVALKELLQVWQDRRTYRGARVGGRVGVESHRVDHRRVQPVTHA